MNRTLRHLVVLSATLALVAATGCGRNLRSFDQVQKAFDHPTGTVSKTTAPTIFANALETNQSGDAASLAANFDNTHTVNFGLSEMGHGLSQQQQGLIQGCSTNFEMTQNLTPKKISVDCKNNPDFSGSLSIEFDYTNNTVDSVFIDYGNWCTSGSCIDGSMGFKFSNSAVAGQPGMTQDFLATARLTLTDNGAKTASVDWAFRDLQSGSTTTVEWLVWASADGQAASWVLSAKVTPAAADITVRGANGTFTCHYAADVTSGSCQDSNGNSWTWTAASS